MLNKIGPYILEKELSSGSYGICYCARDEKNNKYAIKKIKKEDKNQNESIINEINILKIMKSKYSVKFIKFIEKDDYFYIVMELCDGDLKYLLQKMNKKKI